MTRARVSSAALCAAIALAPAAASAEIYSWTDDEGVLHFADLPPSAAPGTGGFGGYEARVVPLPDGKTRTVYRVNVHRYDALLRRAAEHYNLPFAYVKAVAKVESNFNPRAVSHAQAKGMMQLIDSTAASMKVTDPFDPEQNVFGGARYLRVLANMFDGDLALTAAAYNAGPERVRRLGRVPNIRETTRYVKRVLEMYRYYARSEAR